MRQTHQVERTAEKFRIKGSRNKDTSNSKYFQLDLKNESYAKEHKSDFCETEEINKSV